MPRTLALLACLALLLARQPASAEPRAVVELFTSQGCSSCLTADSDFEELVKRKDVVALSFHVDYWDYLGWRDTLGHADNTARQRQYLDMLKTRRLYTPQIVVNGMIDVLGSDRAGIEAAIASSSLPVPVRMSKRGGTIVIEVAARPLPGSRASTIRLIMFKTMSKVSISEGENAGSTIAYANVVRAIRPIGMWDGSAVKVKLPEDELFADASDGCAVIVQEDFPQGPGAIIGAALLKRW